MIVDFVFLPRWIIFVPVSATCALLVRATDKNFLNELENRSRYFGSLIGALAGEPFYVREALNVDDPIELLSRKMNLYS